MADRIDGVKKLFTSKSARVETNRGDTYYSNLFERCEARLEELRAYEPANKIDFNDPDAIEQEVYCVVGFKEKQLLSISNWEYKRIPKKERVYIRGVFEETNEFHGRSLLMKLYQTQRELNDLHNTIMNNAMLCIQKIFVKKK